MTVTIELSPDEEAACEALARAEGLSVGQWIKKLAREHAAPNHSPSHPQAANLSDLLLTSPFAGADLDLQRSMDYPRPVNHG